MEVAASNKDAVGGGVGVNPAREVKGGFDEQELAVVVADSDGEGREVEGDLKD